MVKERFETIEKQLYTISQQLATSVLRGEPLMQGSYSRSYGGTVRQFYWEASQINTCDRRDKENKGQDLEVKIEYTEISWQYATKCQRRGRAN